MARLASKSASERVNNTIDWSGLLSEGDSIAISDVTVSGVTLVADTNDANSVTFIVEGGTDGTVATITNTITTTDGLVETEVFTMPITAGEPVSLGDVKTYLRVMSEDEDVKIAAMIPRARAWVEDHTGLALVRRSFTERRRPEYGRIDLYKGPLVSVEPIDHEGTSYEPRAFAPSTSILANSVSGWPSLSSNEAFEITYTAGFGPGEADERLIGAMLALIEGEYAEGYAYPARSVEAAERCCSYLRTAIL